MLWEALAAARDLGRLRDIAGILIRHGFGEVVRRIGLADALQRAGQALHWGAAAEFASLEPPVRVRQTLEELGPTFVKLGQLLATRFPRSTDMMRARRDLLAHANPLKGFIDECCQVDPDNKVTVTEFYVAYRLWVMQSGYTMTQTRSKVKENLEHQGYVITRRNAGMTIIGLKLR